MTAVSQLSKDLNGTGFQPFALPPTPALQNLAAEIDANAAGNTTLSSSTTYANDSAAAAGGVPIGGFYRNGSVVQIRVT